MRSLHCPMSNAQSTLSNVQCAVCIVHTRRHIVTIDNVGTGITFGRQSCQSMTSTRHRRWSKSSIRQLAPSLQVVVLDTHLGRLGLAICEDLLWRSPVVEAAEDAGRERIRISDCRNVQKKKGLTPC